MKFVVKIGGSLLGYRDELEKLCSILGELAAQYKLLVVPGGGKFADLVRSVDKVYGLSPLTSHRMAILAMDQYGLLLADITPNSTVVYTLDEIGEIWKKKRLPILLPSRLLFTSDELPFSWDVTSDTISAYIARLLKIKKLILVKDVDGIFARDPKKYPETFMLKEITPKELLNIETCIDTFLPKFLLLEKGLTCYVINGLHPERIKQIMEGKKQIATIIKP